MAARILNSFKIQADGKTLDYRLGEQLNLDKVASFFQKNYQVKKIWSGPRHAFAVLEKDGTDYFLKLSTSEGISVVTKREYDWNNYFNQYFPQNLPYKVPKNHENGLYKTKYFYLITDYFKGELLCPLTGNTQESNNLTKYIPKVIDLSQLIQKMPQVKFTGKMQGDYKEKFMSSVNKWFGDIPTGIQKQFDIRFLLQIVEEGIDKLSSRPRHGDFTPWHMIKMENSQLGLVDGEHARADGVEGYDICYFIQRIFAVLKNSNLAKQIYAQAIKKGYSQERLKIVLAGRAIGGFLDESLKEQPDYQFAKSFRDWIVKG